MKKTKPPATPADAILRAIELGGITQAELARRLGHNHPTTVSEWCLGKKQPGMERFVEVLKACKLSGGWSPDGGWWVALPGNVRLPPEGS